MSPERRPGSCSKGDAHVGTSIELESAWLPVHSGAIPSAGVASLPGKSKSKFGFWLNIII